MCNPFIVPTFVTNLGWKLSRLMWTVIKFHVPKSIVVKQILRIKGLYIYFVQLSVIPRLVIRSCHNPILHDNCLCMTTVRNTYIISSLMKITCHKLQVTYICHA